ncbi:thioredoxin family protein [Desulfonatronospira sp.]|uniref:TlpA family protein disulfide reductase n=1 Tax=Desulfonatronospira sp. TaxID=1962951 RepID=UPI0025BB8E9F|nr:thioredoxin family protein [Desulfonatronospira sp.]
MKKILAAVIFFGAVFALMFTYTAQVERDSAAVMENIPKKGTVTMLNIGAEFCPPCKAMEPVLEEVKKQYRDKIHMPYLDMQQHNRQVQMLGVRSTPTQIFFDHQGQERYRHEGMLEKEEIQDILDSLLEKKTAHLSENTKGTS